ncbi:MAG: radical SAM protein [Flavobacterium sp.]|nr:radical SAM protein [Flavobacterium sp.]
MFSNDITDKITGNRYEFSFLVTKYKDGNAWVLYNWLDTQNVKIDDSYHPIYQILESNQVTFPPFEIEDDFSEFEFLLEHKFIVSNQDETRNIVQEKYKETNSNKKLNLILMVVNEACNFDCVYCYEDHSQKQKMGEYDKLLLKQFIEKHSLQELGIDYFGGEPLLNSDFLLSFNKMMIELSNERNINFTSSITTNGYLLTKELFERLINVRINNYQITLDGLKEDHNKLRPLKNGKGTFDTIYSNLKTIAQLPESVHFSITIRINFNTLTATDEKRNEFLNLLSQDFGGDSRFSIHAHSIGNWKGEEDKEGVYMKENVAQELNQKYDNEVQSFGFNSFKIINYAYKESSSCFADKSNSFVIFPAELSPDRKILKVQKCNIALKNPLNTTGYISENGDMIFNSNWHHWVKGTPFKKQGCQNCFFVLNCYGSSCPLNTLLTGEVTCPIEKTKEIELVKDILNFIENN